MKEKKRVKKTDKEILKKKVKLKKPVKKALKEPIKKMLKKAGKKISKKNVKLKKVKKIIGKSTRVPTGIPGFDKIIEGGFEDESVNLVVGGSGSGKTIFAMQFLMEGIKRGEAGLYITFEEKKEEVYEDMLDLGWDLAKAEKAGKFIFLEYSPEKVKMMLEEGGGTIESFVFKYKIKRIVIDSITSFSLLFDDELSKRQAALALFDIIRKWDCTSLLTLQQNPDTGKEAVSSLEFEADSIIFLYFNRIKKERKRFIEVLKMRGTKHSTGIYPLEIKKGIFVGASPIESKILK